MRREVDPILCYNCLIIVLMMMAMMTSSAVFVMKTRNPCSSCCSSSSNRSGSFFVAAFSSVGRTATTTTTRRRHNTNDARRMGWSSGARATTPTTVCSNLQAMDQHRRGTTRPSGRVSFSSLLGFQSMMPPSKQGLSFHHGGITRRNVASHRLKVTGIADIDRMIGGDGKKKKKKKNSNSNKIQGKQKNKDDIANNENRASSALKKKKGKGKKKKLVFRADRVLANRGWASRSECFDVLKKRRVFIQPPPQEAGAETAAAELRCLAGPSEKIPMNAVLFVDRTHEIPKLPPLLKVYHKPKWVLSVMKDEATKIGQQRKTLGDLLVDEDGARSQQDNAASVANMHPVGRLDYDTSGLLLWSSDGTLTQKLLHPTNQVEKEYIATVVGRIDADTNTQEELRAQLQKGVELSLGTFPATVLETKSIPNEQVPSIIESIVQNLPSEYKNDIDKLETKQGYLNFQSVTELSTIRLSVKEGKHRMVRRLLSKCGYPVLELHRIRIGTITLHSSGNVPDRQDEGSVRDLTPDEEAWVNSL